MESCPSASRIRVAQGQFLKEGGLAGGQNWAGGGRTSGWGWDAA